MDHITAREQTSRAVTRMRMIKACGVRSLAGIQRNSIKQEFILRFLCSRKFPPFHFRKQYTKYSLPLGFFPFEETYPDMVEECMVPSAEKTLLSGKYWILPCQPSST